MIRMVFFAPYPEILPVIRQVFSERPDREEFHYEVVQDFFNNPLENINADVAIARGFTAHSMQKKGIICTELRVTGYDVIAAIDICLKLTPVRKIAIVGAFNMVYGAENAGSIYPDIEITCYPILDETRLDEMIQKAIADGNGAIVGGYTTVMLAKAYQIPTVMIKSGREAVNNAIAEARIAAEISFREKERSNEIANIMNYSFQGIMSTDRQGMITFANSYCHTLLKDVKSSFLRHPIREYFPSVPVEHVISDGRKILSDLQYYHDLPLLVNCVPIEGEYDNAGCVLTFQNAAQIQAEEGQIRKKMHPSGFKAKYHFSQIVHNSPIMDAVILDAVNFSYSDSNILIYGETGTGKELFAQSIHNSSPRRNAPFVAINCAALPENLLESELFGYVEGAFTGAAKGGKTGFFEIAHGGTIFLDEIGDISPKLQSRLLRVLQEKEIIRLGNDTVIPVDVRVVSATNKNLREAVARGEFRQDLLYRLNVLELNLPPLRKREEDVALLLQHYIHFEHERTGCHLRALSRRATEALIRYPWPGNIREMKNFCERICILCQKECADLEDVCRALPDLTVHLPETDAPDLCTLRQPAGPKDSVHVYDESAEIRKALIHFRNNRKKTAEYLGIHPSTLWRKMKKYGITAT
ncbi:MAG: sigma 54-interacting transcriptional regulator [Lachnospiraceae bacterium]|jgi:propionate catabolism operon transcriptional regulator|nr:sigma 54-interacting transcriptional regulator [Lachnospiraceae bacterium]MCI9600788.1 sigma 54-interacting transcriptional regulator [Lachnospiraceae bacterium]